MEPSRRQQIEQIEIIERSVTESCRPLTTSDALTFQPQSSIRTSTEKFVTSGSAVNFDPERRFQLTSERDAGQDPSLLYSPSSQPFSFVREPPLHQSTPERHSINHFGYDVHEVQTAEGAARIVETHGGGHLMLDRSFSESVGHQRSPPEQLHSILKQPPIATFDTALSKSPSSDSSVQRKDSYRRMQHQAESDEQQQQPNTSFYGQSSNATVLSKQSKLGFNWTNFGKSERRASGENSFTRLKSSIAELSQQMREGVWSPRLIVVLVLLGLFIVLMLMLLWFLLSALFLTRSSYTFWLYPPVCEDCQKRAGSSYRPPSKLYVQLYSPAQTHFELIGNPPFKSNSFTAIDFETGYVAIADHALTDAKGQHTTCFLMELDRTALPDMNTLIDALKNTYDEIHAQFGWQEYWQFNVESVEASFVMGKFKDRIEDCQNARWYFLKHTVYTKDESCSYCYDFCLPDYAVLRRQKYEDEISLGVRRLNCFRFYVPEWSKYQLLTDANGGHFGYPVHQPQNTQRDANGNWVNWHYSLPPNPTRRRRRNQEIIYI